MVGGLRGFDKLECSGRLLIGAGWCDAWHGGARLARLGVMDAAEGS